MNHLQKSAGSPTNHAEQTASAFFEWRAETTIYGASSDSLTTGSTVQLFQITLQTMKVAAGRDL